MERKGRGIIVLRYKLDTNCICILVREVHARAKKDMEQMKAKIKLLKSNNKTPKEKKEEKKKKKFTCYPIA